MSFYVEHSFCQVGGRQELGTEPSSVSLSDFSVFGHFLCFTKDDFTDWGFRPGFDQCSSAHYFQDIICSLQFKSSRDKLRIVS